MKELLYTVLELEEWEKNIDYLPCEFCITLFSNRGKAVCQIRTRSKATSKLVANDFACQECKEKFENDQIPKCDRCGRLEIHSNVDFYSGKYICDCVRRKEDTLEKELPNLPHEEESTFAFYERQINALREELTTTEEALEVERGEVAKFHEKSEEWGKRQKKELLDQINELKEENKKLKGLISQEFSNPTKLEYKISELEKEDKYDCDFCFLDSMDLTNFKVSFANYQMTSFNNTTDGYLDIVFICNECKKDYDNDVLPWCEKCGRLKRNRNNCFCNRLKFKSIELEDLELEKNKLKEPTYQELLDEISKLKEKVKNLEIQAKQSSFQQVTQTEEFEKKGNKKWFWKPKK